MNTKQTGLTLLEVLIALGVASAATAGLVGLIRSYEEDTKIAVAAQHMNAIAKAAASYIADNRAAVEAGASATQPFLITTNMLSAGNYLQGVQSRNGYGQDVCVLVLEPSAGQLRGLVIAEGGEAINDLDLGRMAALVGASGGAIYSTATGTIRGAFNSWSFAPGAFANANHLGRRCNGSTAGAVTFTAGHAAAALWDVTPDVGGSSFLYRDAVPGHPELNTLATPVILGAGTVQTAGSACGTTGAVGRDAAGAVLSCQGGTWKAQGSAFWKDPVANFASLPMTGDSPGTVRVTLDTRRAFVWSGAAWQALAVDQNGNLQVPGALMVGGNAQVGGNLQTAGRIGTNGLSATSGYPPGWTGGVHTFDVYAEGTVAVGQGGNTSAYMTSSGRVRAGEFVEVGGVANEGWGCSPNGLIGRDGTGAPLFCQGGIWKKPQASSDVQIIWGQGSVNGLTHRGVRMQCEPGKTIKGYFPAVPPSQPGMGGYGGYSVAWRQGCNLESASAAVCYNVYTPGQWDNWNWNANYDWGGWLVCS